MSTIIHPTILTATQASKIFGNDTDIGGRFNHGGLSRMDHTIENPMVDIGIFIIARDGGFTRIDDTMIMTVSHIEKEGFTTEGRVPWIAPEYLRFNTPEDLVKGFDIFSENCPPETPHELVTSIFGPGDMLFCSYLRNAIDEGRIYGDIPVEKRPNFFVLNHHRDDADSDLYAVRIEDKV